MSLKLFSSCFHSVAVSVIPHLVAYGFPCESRMYCRIFTLGSPRYFRMLTNFFSLIFFSLDSRTGGEAGGGASRVVDGFVTTLPEASADESFFSDSRSIWFCFMCRVKLYGQAYVFEQYLQEFMLLVQCLATK